MTQDLETKLIGVLVGDFSPFYDKYVALKKWVNNTPDDVISFGDGPSTAQTKARELGFESPILLYVSKPKNYVLP